MMKTLLIMRFGGMAPLAIERRFITQIVNAEEQPNAVGITMGGGLLSIIRTEMSAEQVAEEYRVMQEQSGVPLPIVVFEVGSTGTSFSLDGHPLSKQLVDLFNLRDIKKPDSVVTSVCNLTLDQLLDLVAQKGLKKLSADELARLKELSKK